MWLAFSFPEWRSRCLIRVGLALSLIDDTLNYLLVVIQHNMSHLVKDFSLKISDLNLCPLNDGKSKRR